MQPGRAISLRPNLPARKLNRIWVRNRPHLRTPITPLARNSEPSNLKRGRVPLITRPTVTTVEANVVCAVVGANNWRTWIWYTTENNGDHFRQETNKVGRGRSRLKMCTGGGAEPKVSLTPHTTLSPRPVPGLDSLSPLWYRPPTKPEKTTLVACNRGTRPETCNAFPR